MVCRYVEPLKVSLYGKNTFLSLSGTEIKEDKGVYAWQFLGGG